MKRKKQQQQQHHVLLLLFFVFLPSFSFSSFFSFFLPPQIVKYCIRLCSFAFFGFSVAMVELENLP